MNDWERLFLSWAGFVAAITLRDVVAIVSLFSGLVAIVYTSLLIYLLWRDKIKRQIKE